MQLYSPWTLLLLLILPGMAYFMLRKKRTAAVRFPSVSTLKKCPVSWRSRLRPILIVLRLACIALLVVALARPRKGTVLSQVATEGVAIEAVVDRSGSMKAEMDYRGKRNRLEVVQEVLAEFIAGNDDDLPGRTGDLIGLITFARYADTVCPLIQGHNVLLEFLKKTEIVRMRNEDGTAIGDAIALAAARLKKAEEEIRRRNKNLGAAAPGADPGDSFKIKSKVIILLTDGRNNMGEYSPLNAASMAAEWGIKIYTIGIGSSESFTTIQTPLGTYKMPTQQDLDEGLLEAIAEETGGFYRRADDSEALASIVKEIDKMEKTEVKSVQYAQYKELFDRWALPALGLLLLEILASCTIFRKIP